MQRPLPLFLLAVCACGWSPPDRSSPSATDRAGRSGAEESETVGTPAKLRTAPHVDTRSTGGPLIRVDLDKVRVLDDVLLKGGDGRIGRLAQCDPLRGSPLGQVWYVFGDDQCEAGTSVSFVEMLHNGWDGNGCTLRWMGRITRKLDHGFAGIGTGLDRDIRSASKVVMEVRGDGDTYRAEFILRAQLDAAMQRETCIDDDWDFYGQQFKCGDGTDVWTEVEIDISSLKQKGFGTAYPFEAMGAEKFQIVTQNSSDHEFQCEFRVMYVE